MGAGGRQGHPGSIGHSPRLNDVEAKYVRNYVRVRGEALRGGPGPGAAAAARPAPAPAGTPAGPRPPLAGPPSRSWRRSWPGTSAAPTPRANGTDRGPGSEWALAHWLTTQRSEQRTGRLPLHRARGLDRVLPSWRLDDRAIENEARWRLRLVGLLRFLADHGRLPKHPGTPGDRENSLAAWLRVQQAAHRAGTLEPERARWLDRQVPGWRQPPDAAEPPDGAGTRG